MSRSAPRESSTEALSEPQRDSRLRFADFELDVDSGELHHAGETVTIQPQPAKVLAYLAERTGSIVSRRELQEHVWGTGHFVDYDQGLNYCIKAVRRVLGDSADDPRFIETIPRRGYRFLVPVRRVEGTVLTLDQPEPRRARSRLARAMAPAVAFALGALALALSASRSVEAPASDAPRLAVLPLHDYGESADPVLEGLTDELIAQLSQSYGGQIGVIARSSSGRFAGSDRSAAEIGAELGADYLLTGSVQRLPETTRVTTQLVRVEDETNVWADLYDHGTSATAWSHWARQVTADVGSVLGLPTDPGSLDQPGPEVYERYLEGIYYANAATPEARARGLELMTGVLDAEPNFTPAILVWARLKRNLEAPSVFMPAVAERLRHAIAVEPRSADAYLELARLQLLHLRDLGGAARSVERALDLNPRMAKAHHTHAMVLSAQGRHREAFEAMRRALLFDPLSAELVSHRGWSHFLAREYARAIEHSRHALEMEPQSPVARSCILFSAIELGDPATALEQARLLSGLELASLDEYWRAALEAYASESRADGYTHGMQALPLIHLDRHDEAMSVLLRACRDGSSWPIAFAAVDPRLDPLRDHPRFDELLACAGLATAPSV